MVLGGTDTTWRDVVPEGLEKNRIGGMVTSRPPFRVPVIVVLVETVLAEVRTGLFCRPLGPESTSPGSLAVLTG